MRITVQEYIDALSDYFHYTKKLVPMASEAFNKSVTTIQRYEAMNKKPEKMEIIALWFLLVLISILSSFLMAALLMFGANEVFGLAIDYSFKNLMIVACVFFFGKIRTKVKIPGTEYAQRKLASTYD